MIARYSHPEMQAIWSDETRFSIWLEIELLALEQMSKEGLLPPETVAEVRQRASYDVQRISEIEAEVKHDVIAFLTNVAEKVGPAARFLHRGMTSSDVLDTAFAVQLSRAGALIMTGLERAIAALEKRALEFKHLPCIGRTHGMHAEPITFGLKLLSWACELKRQRKHLREAIELVSVGKIAGAVGTYSSVSPEVEAYVLGKLGLKPESVPSQIVHRDRHAAFFNVLALLASSLEKFCVEIRHLQRTEVSEAAEPFGKGQKGSSAMPHKKNPVLCENLAGLSRLVRGYALAAMENIALWHERDISHSSCERVIGPDACIVVDFMLRRFNTIIEGLVVDGERMSQNLALSGGIVFSGNLMLVLVDSGLSREEAYRLVQKHALAAWKGGPSFAERIKRDPEIMKCLDAEKLSQVFDLQRSLRYVDYIFARAAGE
mgnify:CR=1 FL=1